MSEKDKLIKKLQRQVKNWERKEIKKASCCSDNESKLQEATKLMNSLQDQVIDREKEIDNNDRAIQALNIEHNRLCNRIQELELENTNLKNPPPPVYPKPVGYSGTSNAKVYWKVGV